ncbi:hypothetical protein AZE42_09127 [Rhizopogon vesiculosus]|uniref:Uncharacterized protein n=1 Tax=Rhizopogon vesiculosus TaxID=180088 RepID=A0A1J8QM91_9AGAM|nr:hypothetical protein AZE42_09127 [Rhizopogon vesiculosus]
MSEVVPSGTITESFIIWVRGHQVHTLSKISMLAVWSAEVASILVARLDPSYTPEGVYEARAVQLLRTLHPTPITTAFLAGSLAVTGSSGTQCSGSEKDIGLLPAGRTRSFGTQATRPSFFNMSA